MRNVRTAEDALLYLLDCSLATVSCMASKKSRGKWEFERQIEIAQKTINWVLEFNINVQINSRAYDVLSLNDRSVETWSKQFYPK